MTISPAAGEGATRAAGCGGEIHISKNWTKGARKLSRGEYYEFESKVPIVQGKPQILNPVIDMCVPMSYTVPH